MRPVVRSAIAILLFSAKAVGSQTVKIHPRTQQPKDPVLAALSSAVFPGLGQLYNGERQKALGFAIAGGLGVMLILTERFGASFWCGGSHCGPPPGSTYKFAQMLWWVSWGASFVDAPITAININKQVRATASIRLVAPLGTDRRRPRP